MGNNASNEIEIFAEGELEEELRRLGGTGEIGVKEFIVKGYNDVIETVIRPPRAQYDLNDLGPSEYHVQDKENHERYVRRRDFHVENDRGLKLVCSHWQLFSNMKSTTPLVGPCLLYLHSNIGSRADVGRVRDLALRRGMAVFAFDFSGSGNSDGVYVTMGWNECKDLHFVLQHLEQDSSVGNICIYAHSMGTFPAIVNVACRSLAKGKIQQEKFDALPSYFRHGNVNTLAKPIKGLVLDGGYSTMKELIKELIVSVQEEGFKVPSSVMKLACKVVMQSIKKRAEVDLERLRPMDFVPQCSVPACFITGRQDEYVRSHHSKQLADKYAGPSIVLEVDGQHYEPRTEDMYAQAIDFLYGSLRSVAM